jgi:hypothetical protein
MRLNWPRRRPESRDDLGADGAIAIPAQVVSDIPDLSQDPTAESGKGVERPLPHLALA